MCLMSFQPEAKTRQRWPSPQMVRSPALDPGLRRQLCLLFQSGPLGATPSPNAQREGLQQPRLGPAPLPTRDPSRTGRARMEMWSGPGADERPGHLGGCAPGNLRGAESRQHAARGRQSCHLKPLLPGSPQVPNLGPPVCLSALPRQPVHRQTLLAQRPGCVPSWATARCLVQPPL